MKLKKLLISMLAVVSLAIGSVGTASAACVGTGKVVRLQDLGGSVLIWLAPRTQFPSYHFRLFTTNHNFLSKIDAATANSRFIRYETDGTDCTPPAAGGSKVIGTLTRLDLYMDL